MRQFGTSVAVILLLASTSAAEPRKAAEVLAQRYELGQRLKRFEQEWEKQDNPVARKRALAHVQKLTEQFLTLQFGEAARSLDLAGFALTSDEEPSVTRQWAWSLFAVPELRVVDGKAQELTVTIKQFYVPKGDVPKSPEVQFWFTDKQITTLRPDKFPHTLKVPLPPLGEFVGLDRRLYFMVESGREIRRSAIGISQVADLDARLAALKKTVASWDAIDTIEKATARDRAELLTELVGGFAPETDLPAADLLKNAETMLDGNPFFTSAKSGQFWLSVPTDAKKSVPTRIFVPRGLDPKKPAPVVVALHGAGGSENLFFEGYGAGQLVTECRKRGWVLVATRSGLNFSGAPPVPAILDQLAKRYELDPKRVFVIGHSMGATQAVGLVRQHPDRFAAVAVLSGGGPVKDAKAFADLPFFIGAGEKDFALTSARALNKALVAGGAKNVTYKEYPHVEHMVIVREALADVFAVFDKRAK
ncbi:Phospholipase/Carboxylesterase OS=Isosphaera pallida (strain ATCC 43644 / DSM 9630 / IS1B) GN=Isop_0604 PE=4 SV=1: Abhydrolase_5 [Gemmata massiliana]|uniref:AB hydrolase-1 domain-containing protein n=1 Tax=Gemmata massiliana TaxID=1210884 RepID=A0A6P2DFD6_9BACT|nr:alpha/beta fold hydrolase [Gemmata massiliana]VTR98344.1 Phospholipase/Carboxylesterase OS=Isosphaera pallida (strain ATCC 43644 / DSM 9630 / IS1B) GN=Isop_0604 PE=4 SV=1: Abhydrolase_5 [Gemmata massiliana]